MWGMLSPSSTHESQTIMYSRSTTAITFLAQWHPLINPERNDLRPEYQNGPIKSGSRF